MLLPFPRAELRHQGVSHIDAWQRNHTSEFPSLLGLHTQPRKERQLRDLEVFITYGICAPWEHSVIYLRWLQDVGKMFCLLWQSQIKVCLCHWLALWLQSRYMSILSSTFLVLQNKDTNTYLWGYYNIMCCMLSSFSCVWLFVTPWNVACQAPLSMWILQARIPE